MTWHYQISTDGTTLRLWDEQTDPSSDPSSSRTISPERSVPDRRLVLDAMFKEAEAAYDAGNVRRAIIIVGYMAGEQIEVIA